MAFMGHGFRPIKSYRNSNSSWTLYGRALHSDKINAIIIIGSTGYRHAGLVKVFVYSVIQLSSNTPKKALGECALQNEFGQLWISYTVH